MIHKLYFFVILMQILIQIPMLYPCKNVSRLFTHTSEIFFIPSTTKCREYSDRGVRMFFRSSILPSFVMNGMKYKFHRIFEHVSIVHHLDFNPNKHEGPPLNMLVRNPSYTTEWNRMNLSLNLHYFFLMCTSYWRCWSKSSWGFQIAKHGLCHLWIWGL